MKKTQFIPFVFPLKSHSDLDLSLRPVQKYTITVDGCEILRQLKGGKHPMLLVMQDFPTIHSISSLNINNHH
jgi:hypothetical protein